MDVTYAEKALLSVLYTEVMANSPLIALRVDENTKQKWQEMAQQQGKTLTQFIRDAVNAQLGKPALTTASVIQKEQSGCVAYVPRGTKCKLCGKVH